MPQDINRPSNYIDNAPQFPTEEDKQLQVVLSAFNYSRSFYSFRYMKFRTWLRLFHRIPDSRPPFRSNLFVPLVYPLVMTVLPRLISNKPTFRFEPREESDQQATEQMQTLVDYQLERTRFLKKLKMWVKDTLMFGTGIAKVYWKRDDDEDINDPEIEIIDLFDWFPDPKATQIEGGDFMVQRTILPITYLKNAVGPNGKKLYHGLDEILDSTNEENTNKIFLTNDRSMTIGDIDARLVLGTPYRQSMTKQIEILEYWGIFGKDDDECVITVANRNKVIRFEKNPYGNTGKDRPFVKMEIDPNNFLFYGTGLIDTLEHLQIALNDTRNQRMDNVNLILNKLFVVLKEADVNEQELISRPGGVIYEGIPNGVRILETPDITNSAYQEEAILKQDAQETIGVSDIIQGQLSDASGAGSIRTDTINSTATGAKIAIEQAGSRFKYYMQNVEDALETLGEKLYHMNQEFLTEEKVIRIAAPNDYGELRKQSLVGKIKEKMGLGAPAPAKFIWNKIKPDSIKNISLDVKVESGSTQPIEESLKQQKVMTLIGLLGQLPVTTPETYLELANEILTAFQVSNKDKILSTLQVNKSGGPKAAVTVSLKGDINPFQAADLAKNLGASPESSDPQLVATMEHQKQSDEVNKELIKHGAKGAVDSQLKMQEALLNNAREGTNQGIPQGPQQ